MICTAMFCLLGAWALDGDTLRARAYWGAQSFRIWGIQAPERGEPGYYEATMALRALTEDEMLSCDVAGYPTWSRQAVRCTTSEGVDLGCEMIRQGHAVEWVEFSRGAYAGCRPE